MYWFFFHMDSAKGDKGYSELCSIRSGHFFTPAQYVGGKEDNNFSYFGSKTVTEGIQQRPDN
jgi:hypothetical protein